jgi:hypothetical protein
MRSVCCALLLATLAGGCGWKPLFMRGDVAPLPPPAAGKETPVIAAPPPPPPVTADQVNESNSAAKAKALWDELDRDQMNGASETSFVPDPVRPR